MRQSWKLFRAKHDESSNLSYSGKLKTLIDITKTKPNSTVYTILFSERIISFLNLLKYFFKLVIILPTENTIEGVLKLVDRLNLGFSFLWRSEGSIPSTFKMQAKINKNKKFRQKYLNNEWIYYLNSALTKNNLLIEADKNILKNNIINNYLNMNKSHSYPKITKIRNLCLITGRSRALIQDYRISRLKFKDLAETGHLSGIKKK